MSDSLAQSHELRQFTPSEAVGAMEFFMRLKIVPLLRGSPGIGKSSIFMQIAKTHGLKFIDIRLAQCDPTDLNGFPAFVDGKAEYMPMDIFPLQGEKLPPDTNGWLILFDELPSAMAAVQAASYKILLDRMIGSKPLHDNVWMAAAGNLESDNAIVESLSTALQSRLAHFELVSSTEDWLNWAYGHGIDSSITAFISHFPKSLHTFDPDHTDTTYGCPRTWEFADRICKRLKDHPIKSTTKYYGSVLSVPLALQFVAFQKYFDQFATLAEMIAKPMEARLPTQLGAEFAMLSMVAESLNADNVVPLLKYVGRLEKEKQVVMIKEAWKRNPKIKELPEIIAWMTSNAEAFFKR